MTHRPAYLLSAFMGLCLLQMETLPLLFAQSNQVQHWDVSGQYDSGFPPPVIEGKPGEKDASAVNEIRTFVTGTTPQGWPGIQAEGMLMVGGGQTIREFPASLVVESGGKYRLDVHASSEASSVRVDGRVGTRRQADGTFHQLQVPQMGSPFFLPSELWETVNRANVSVIDDGSVMIEGQRMHKITLILPGLSGNPQAAITSGRVTAVAFYFDPAKHYLLKKIAVGHYPGETAHQYLQITTYNDYREIQGAIVPFVISETDNGQHGMTFKASNVSETSQHEASYFHF